MNGILFCIVVVLFTQRSRNALQILTLKYYLCESQKSICNQQNELMNDRVNRAQNISFISNPTLVSTTDSLYFFSQLTGFYSGSEAAIFQTDSPCSQLCLKASYSSIYSLFYSFFHVGQQSKEPKSPAVFCMLRVVLNRA